MRRMGASVKGSLSTADGRWMLASSSLTASVAFTVTWLSLAAEPASAVRADQPRTKVTALPYDLFARLMGSSETQEASLISSPELIGPVDRMLAHDNAGKRNVETRTLRMDNGDTIIGMLQGAGVPSKDAAAIVEAMKSVFSARNIRSGQVFEATFSKPTAASSATPVSLNTDADGDDDSVAARTRRLLSLSFSPSIEHQITVKLTAPDSYMAKDYQLKLEGHYQHAGGTIDSSLYLAAMKAGLPANIVVEMIRMFSYDVDFQRDVHPGDSFEVFYNHLFTPDGDAAKPGDILEASMTLGGRKQTLYRYDTEDGPEYFNPQGQSVKGMLMKTPVDGARISSSFGQREHPILGYTRMHKGIDFAVPMRTPVMAAGNGTVTYAGWGGDFGNLVVVNHANGYATAYAHLSRLGAGIKSGAHVHQGQIIAFSGMTGLATGPHLHYEVRVNNVQVNPATVKVAGGRILTGSQLTAFVRERRQIDTMVAALPMQHQLALANSGLRELDDQ